MKRWETYTSEQQILNNKDLVQRYILERLGSCIHQFFEYEKPIRPQRTRLIKETLTLLGHEILLGKERYKVYSHGLSEKFQISHGGEFINTEWLYDLHWYTEIPEEDFMPEKLALVMECEWNPRWGKDQKIPFGGFKYDFQKLLVANAQLRLMIFIIKKDSDLDKLDKYFEKAINSYQYLQTGAKFLFVAYDERIRGFHYAEKKKE